LSGREPEDDNQMIYTFETLVPGAEIICRLSLTPYAAALEEAALRTALRTFEEQDMTLGGQSARGYGKVELDRIAMPEATGNAASKAYDEYLGEHKEDLRQGIIDGTLMSGAEVVSG
jgi:CRISPR/Cas system CSM-associated protein Csm3 (group 7 of RAMP superfamily)